MGKLNEAPKLTTNINRNTIIFPAQDTSRSATPVGNQLVGIEANILYDLLKGATGTSAYQSWLNAGNTGNEATFLASLVGPRGFTGNSAYQTWLAAGNTGNEAAFLASLKGTPATEYPTTEVLITDLDSINAITNATYTAPTYKATGISISGGTKDVLPGQKYYFGQYEYEVVDKNAVVRKMIIGPSDLGSNSGGSSNLGPSYQRLMAKMENREGVTFAVFGDEPDGATTTSWTANSTSGSDSGGLGLIPTGTGAHTTATNAWPAKLQTLLQEMYSVNTGILVWNAGYNGQKMYNGWAVKYYDAAVTNNPAYGIPDVCFIQFGVSDIADSAFTFQAYYDQTKLLITKLKTAGIVPVLVSSSPIYMSTYAPDVDTRDMAKLTRQVNVVKQSLAIEMGVAYFDSETEIKRAFEINNDGYKWTANQTNRYQFGNTGHYLTANYFGALLFKDTVWIKDSSIERLFNTDSRSKTFANSNAYVASGSRQGGSAFIASTRFGVGRRIMTIYPYVQLSDATLMYRGVNNEGSTVRSQNPIATVVEKTFGTTVFTDKINNAGSPLQAASYQVVDTPNYVTQLPYGLSLVTYNAPTVNTSSITFGYYEIVPYAKIGLRSQSLQTYYPYVNTLKETGGIWNQAVASSGITTVDGGELRDLSNVLSFGRESRAVQLNLEIQLDPGMGYMFQLNKGYGASGPKLVGAMLYRSTSSLLKLYKISLTSGNVLSFVEIGSATYSVTGINKLRIDLSRNASNANQDITVWPDWTGSGTALITSTQGTDIVPWAGYCNGLFSDSTAHGAGTRTIEIKQANIIYK